MSFTYSGNPSTSNRDAVRFLIGDTDPTEPLLQDGEIAYLLSLYSDNVRNACIRACETIMAKYARLADESVGSVSISLRQKFENYKSMRDELKARMVIEDCMPFAGGISKSQKQLEEQDTDRVNPSFTKHMMENEDIAPWTSDVVDNGVQGQGD